MKNIILFSVSILVGIVLIFVYVKINTKRPAKTLISSPSQAPAFSLDTAPSQSIRANITTMSGAVNWQSRSATDSAKLAVPRQIQQGEQIDTGENGLATVEFPTFATIKISPSSQINFAQTLPANFVFGQTKGTVNYVNTGKTHLSVRTLHLLTDLADGDITTIINRENPFVTIVVAKGQITVAYNDLQNSSQVQTFQQGDRIVFNDTTRKLLF